MYNGSKAAIQMEILKPKNEQIDEYLGRKKQPSAAKTGNILSHIQSRAKI
jgi:hypothetical protein